MFENIPGVKDVREISGCTLILGDCLQILPHLGGLGAIVADPPYGISYSRGEGGRVFGKSKRHTSAFDGKTVIGDDRPFDPKPLLDMGVPTILWGANHYSNKLPNSAKWLVWDKRRGTGSNDFADCEMAWTNLKGPARCLPHMWNGGLRDSERGIPRVHQTQKPIAVMDWCLSFIPDDVTPVLDPFMGSGTTLVSCVKAGKRGIGIEIDPGYFGVACRRVSEAGQQSDLFHPQPAANQEAMKF